MIKSQPSDWLKFAKDDLNVAEELISRTERYSNSICFHSQQCVEKCLKAFIVKYEGAVERIHPLKSLWKKAAGYEKELEKFRKEINILARYYIPTRYPDALPGSLPEGLPIKEDAEEALGFAKEIFEFTERKL